MVTSTSEDEAKPASATVTGRIKQWLLLDGNRFAIASIFAVVFGLVYLVLSTSGIAPLADMQPLYYLFSGLITGNFTLITVVVSINQLVLSQELESPGQLQSEIERTVDYRETIEEVTNRTAPAEPSGFLRLVVESARQDVQRLGGTAVNTLPADARGEIDEIVTDLTDEFDRIDRLVEESESGVFNTLSTTLEVNFAHEIQRLSEFRRVYADDISAEVDEEIDETLDRLREIDIARQYFKSMYLQVELSRLSRYLFYSGIPAVGVALAALFVMTTLSDLPFAEPAQTVVFPITVMVGMLPLTLLFSYILRTATVTERTAAITPFTTPE